VSRSGRNIGLIQLADRFRGEFTAQDEAILMQLARLASAAVENTRLSSKLLEADQHRDQFLAMLAHELRNPLAPLRNAVQMLQLRDDDPETVHWARDLIDRQVQHIAHMVADMIDASRLARGKVQFQFQRLDLAALVRTTVDDQRGDLEKAGLALQVELPAGEVWIQGDPTRLAQALGNLLHNASKFTEPGGQVTVRVVRTGSRAAITVEDTGMGIEPALLPRLFDVLTQADHSLERSKGGLGLGLAVVKGLVELHGGGVSVDSEGLHRGARFSFWLPTQEKGAPPAPT
jgi:signal transduction histidine kinase